MPSRFFHQASPDFIRKAGVHLSFVCFLAIHIPSRPLDCRRTASTLSKVAASVSTNRRYSAQPGRSGFFARAQEWTPVRPTPFLSESLRRLPHLSGPQSRSLSHCHTPPPPQFLRLHRLRRVLLPLSSSRQHPSPPGRREIADAHRPARRFRRRKIPPTLPICPTREHSRRHDHPLRQRPGRPGGLGLLRPLPRLHLLPLLLPLPCPEPGARTPGLRGG